MVESPGERHSSGVLEQLEGVPLHLKIILRDGLVGLAAGFSIQ